MSEEEATIATALLFLGSFLFTAVLLLVLWCIPKTREAMKRGDEEWRAFLYKRDGATAISDVDEMTGDEFERVTVRVLKANGYTFVTKTVASGDYGIDVTAEKNGKKYAFQCKRYSGNVGVKAVQEAYSGAKMYHADVAAVITNSSFTPNAQNMAKEIGVLLIDRNGLIKLMRNAERGGPEDGVDQL